MQPSTAFAQLAATVSERDFLDAVVQAAMLQDWMVYHALPARTLKGWRTQTQGHPGFPDLVLIRDGQLEVWELKSEKGAPTLEQLRWLEAWDAAGAATAIYRPSDAEQIARVLA